MQTRTWPFKTWGLSCIGVLALIFFTTIYNSHVQTVLHDQASSYIEEIRVSTRFILTQEINQTIRILESFDFFTSQSPLQSDEDIVSALKNFAKSSSFKELIIFSHDGTLYTNFNDQPLAYDVSAYSKQLNTAASHVGNPRYSAQSDGMVLDVSVPLRVNSKPFGRLSAAYPLDSFKKILDTNFPGGTWAIGLALPDGTVLFQSRLPANTSLFGWNAHEFFLRSDVQLFAGTPDAIRRHWTAGETGYTAYSHHNISRHMAYGPAGVNDWLLVAVSIEESLKNPSGLIERATTILAVLVALTTLLLTTLAGLHRLNDQKARNTQLQKMAEIDGLTGLLNKATTERRIKNILSDRRRAHRKAALIIIDIDNFKSINDNLGHLYGDTALKDIAAAVQPIFRTGDVIGRVGGDEFLVFMNDLEDDSLLAKKASALCDAFRKTYCSGNVSVHLSASIGMALCPDHGTEYETLYKKADLALYAIKTKGKDGYTLYAERDDTI